MTETQGSLHARIADAVVDGPAEAIVACDREGAIRFWNPGAVRIFGFTAQEAVGQSLDIIIPERLRRRHWEGYDAMMRTGKSRYGVGHILSVPSMRKDGTPISIDFTIVAMNDGEGRPEMLVATMRDATQRFNEMKALRQQLRERAG
jgi:PAS domain S-box-containing protein